MQTSRLEFAMLNFRKMPQMTKNEIKFILDQSKNFKTILEFGSGRSTLIWANHFQNVISVETRLNWFSKISKIINAKKLNNVRMVFSPPESCAFSENGSENWNMRVPSDYGKQEEFSQYLKTAKTLIRELPEPSLIFIDANMRSEILDIALGAEIQHYVLVHDVVPERRYLNQWENDPAYNILENVDSLRAVRFLR